MSAITSKMWMRLPPTWNAKAPRSHRMNRMMAIVQSMGSTLFFAGYGSGTGELAARSYGCLDQPRLLQRGLDEPGEQGMRLERPTLQLRVELDPDEPRVVGPLDDLGQLVVGRHSRENQA